MMHPVCCTICPCYVTIKLQALEQNSLQLPRACSSMEKFKEVSYCESDTKQFDSCPHGALVSFCTHSERNDCIFLWFRLRECSPIFSVLTSFFGTIVSLVLYPFDLGSITVLILHTKRVRLAGPALNGCCACLFHSILCKSSVTINSLHSCAEESSLLIHEE